jgi:hypothetical protein
MSEIPKVVVLGPITPTDNGDSLSYKKLDDAANKHAPYEVQRFNTFYDAEPDSLEEEEAARQLAMQFLLMTAKKQISPETNENMRQVWSERYTKATSEIYGAPEKEVAIKLLESQLTDLRVFLGNPKVNQELLAKTLSFIEEQLAGTVTTDSIVEPTSEKYDGAGSKVKKYLLGKYSKAFSALELEDEKFQNTPEDIVRKFSAAVYVLAETDADWSDWKVLLAEDKDSLSIIPGSKEIIVGAQRRPAPNSEIQGLFAHEILLHAQRSVNGRKIDESFGTGLPGYLDFEEGLGTFFEYAVTDKIPQKNIDRYIDISIATGTINGRLVDRNTLMNFARNRELIRLQSMGKEIDLEFVNNKVAAHVNRIYRGTTGDSQSVGVFTKDISYQKGFEEAATYIQGRLQSGEPVEKIMSFLLRGKFSPLDQRHIDYLESLR